MKVPQGILTYLKRLTLDHKASLSKLQTRGLAVQTSIIQAVSEGKQGIATKLQHKLVGIQEEHHKLNQEYVGLNLTTKLVLQDLVK